MIQALGWALVHFLWQGTAIALLLVAANRALRRATPNARYLAACAALVLMLAAPVATFFRLSRPIAEPVALSAAPTAQIFSAVAPSDDSPVPPSGEIPWLPLIVAVWATGVALLSVRMAGGLLVARRLRLRATPVTNREWRERIDRLAARLRLRRGVALCESALAEVPMTIGWLRPAILVPAGALLRLSPEQMEAILAHELAHVRRLDFPVNLLQKAVETLLFYHPAVWWVGRRIRAERENCCDDLAVAICGDAVVYARALVELETLAAGRAPQVALAATGGSLLDRVKRLLHAERVARRSPGAGLAAVLVVLVLATAWLSTQPMLHAASHAADATAPVPRISIWLGQAAGKGQTPTAAPQQPERKPRSATAKKHEESYVQEIAAAGYPHLSADDLIAFKTQGVTAGYIRQIRAAGFTPPAGQLLAMRVTGVTGDYAKQMKASFPKITIPELIACRTQGVGPQAAHEFSGLGLEKLTLRQVIAARVQGVTPAYVRSLKSQGFTNLTMTQVIGARVQGVTPEFVRGLKSEGFTDLTMNQVIGARVQGVTPEFVRGLKSAGFTNLAINQAIAARVQGVTPEYVGSLKGLGFPNLTFNEALRAKVMGLTPEFVREARQHGFQNLTIDKLIRLKSLGVLADQ